MRKQKNQPSALPDDPRLRMIKTVSKLMDEQFTIGGFKFGLDPLLNLIPIAGDVGSYLVSVVLVLTMVQHGVSGKVAMKMIGNITLDALVGAIPFLGWIFDFTFKANTRNVKILTEHYTQGKHRGSAKPVIIATVIILLIVLIGIAYLSFILLRWLIHWGDRSIGVTI